MKPFVKQVFDLIPGLLHVRILLPLAALALLLGSWVLGTAMHHHAVVHQPSARIHSAPAGAHSGPSMERAEVVQRNPSASRGRAAATVWLRFEAMARPYGMLFRGSLYRYCPPKAADDCRPPGTLLALSQMLRL